MTLDGKPDEPGDDEEEEEGDEDDEKAAKTRFHLSPRKDERR